MTGFDRVAGRGIPRPVLVGGVALLLAGAGWALTRGDRDDEARRGPAALPNPAATPVRQQLVGSVRYLVGGEAPELLLPDTLFPSRPVRLLWFEGRVASPAGETGALALDGAGGVLYFDASLNQRGLGWDLGEREIVSAAQSGDGTFWLTDGEGAVLRIGADGTVRELGHSGPFGYPAVAGDWRGSDGGVWLVRRAQRWEYQIPDPDAPLLAKLDVEGRVAGSVGKVVVPQAPFFAELASAGYLAVAGDTLYYAPFIRDEIYAFSTSGDTLWVADRELPQSVDEPRVSMEEGAPVIEYHPVNLGITVGPDDRLYVLSTPGFTTEQTRLDVFDRQRGVLLRSAVLSTAMPTIAADPTGRVYLLDSFRLLTGVDPGARDPFSEFDLPLLGGGRASSRDFAGKVVLVNFWASWCTPCRTEMPALDSLRRRLEAEYHDFQFITMNEDVDVSAAEQFIAELGFDFPVLLGRGQLRRQYHYIGLPMTVLLDRSGRVVQRWSGFAGPEQIKAIERVARRELEREEAATAQPEHHHH
ncbi:Thiol-disulfide oxidoreductase ResA [bacterium HR33]|nr:Thiol-disulfide oxidoreductase ResA [bacterium HR33]